MSMNLINTPAFAHALWLTAGFHDDFIGLDTTLWNTTTTDSGTVAEDQDGINGLVTLSPSDGTVADNDEAYLYTNEISKYLNGKPIFIGARIQYAEAATNVANILFGIGEGFGVANTLLDNGGGPPADYDGACIFKVDGGTRWTCESSLGTSQNTRESRHTAGGSSFVSLAMELIPLSATVMEVTYWIDTAGGNAFVQMMPYDSPENPRAVPIKHRFAYSSPGEMALCIGVKNGSAVQQPLDVDLVQLWQKR